MANADWPGGLGAQTGLPRPLPKCDVTDSKICDEAQEYINQHHYLMLSLTHRVDSLIERYGDVEQWREEHEALVKEIHEEFKFRRRLRKLLWAGFASLVVIVGFLVEFYELLEKIQVFMVKPPQ